MKVLYLILVVLALAFMAKACGQKSSKDQAHVNEQEQNQEYQEMQKMDRQGFWQIIEYSAKEANGDEYAQMEAIRELLMGRSSEDVLEFVRIQAQLLNETNHYNAVYAYAIIDGMTFSEATSDKLYVSDDGFLYFRIWLIYQGEEMYTQTLKNPDYLADKVNPADEVWNEMIAGVGMEVYMDKAGSVELPEDFLQTSFDETVKGERYPVKELPEKFPKLWAKFMDKS